METITIPIASKNSELHKGHLYLVDKASSFGNILVVIKPDLFELSNYMKTGVFKNTLNNKQIISIDDKNIPYIKNEIQLTDNKTRNNLIKKASSLVEIYRNQLLIPEYISRATYGIAQAWLSRSVTKNKYDTMILGPEPIHFFFKSITKLLGPKNIIINDNLIKSKKTRIRYQGMYENVVDSKKHFIPNIRNIIDDAKKFYSIGYNKSLTKELNYSYSNKNWKIKDIVVYEGGFVENRRIELTRFIMVNNTKTNSCVVLEEIDQYD